MTTTQTCATNANCPGGETCNSYWAYGMRNSFGLTTDPATGALWDTENGPESYDEVNRVAPEGLADLWNMPGAGVTYSDPELSWFQTVAPTAILFPVGSSLGATYDQVALVSDTNFGNLYSLALNVARTGFALPGALADGVADTQSEAEVVRLGQAFQGITDLELGPDGHVYVVEIAGPILRISGPRDNDVTALPGAFAAALIAALAVSLVLALARPV